MGTKRLNRPQEAVYNDLFTYVFNLAEKHGDCIDAGKFQEADGGAEAIVANWNNDYLNRVAKFLNSNYTNVSQEWDDTTARCYCGKLITTIPTHWGWQPKYVFMDKDACYLCQDCALEAADEVIEQAMNNERIALWSWFLGALQERGWVCLEDDANACARFETGFHAGQTDDPVKVKAHVQQTLPDHDLVFVINDVGQFDMRWSVHIKRKEV